MAIVRRLGTFGLENSFRVHEGQIYTCSIPVGALSCLPLNNRILSRKGPFSNSGEETDIAPKSGRMDHEVAIHVENSPLYESP